MISSQAIIGAKLKQLRKQQKKTLKEVAEQMNFSSPFLSMVENGRSGISLSNLQRLLAIYGRNMADLIDNESTLDRIVTLKKAVRLGNGRDTDGVEVLLLVNRVQEKRMEPVFFRFEPGATLGPMRHEGEEFSHVIDGSFEVTLEDPSTEDCEIYHLSVGDTIYFDSRIPHTWRNTSPDKVGVFIGAVTPATF